MKMFKKDIKIKRWGRRVRNSTFFRLCLSLDDYQVKANRYRKGLTYLKNRETTNQNQIRFTKAKKRTQALMNETYLKDREGVNILEKQGNHQ